MDLRAENVSEISSSFFDLSYTSYRAIWASQTGEQIPSFIYFPSNSSTCQDIHLRLKKVNAFQLGDLLPRQKEFIMYAPFPGFFVFKPIPVLLHALASTVIHSMLDVADTSLLHVQTMVLVDNSLFGQL